jgi:hypothetical protein
MRNQLRCSGIRTAASMFFLLTLATPLLYANDLVICKVSDSGTPLQDQTLCIPSPKKRPMTRYSPT